MKKEIEEIWTQAFDSPVGVKVQTDDPSACYRELILSRMEMLDGKAFEYSLSIREGEIWIMRNKVTPEVKTSGEYKPFEE